jgi:hypothetical protein
MPLDELPAGKSLPGATHEEGDDAASPCHVIPKGFVKPNPAVVVTEP